MAIFETTPDKLGVLIHQHEMARMRRVAGAIQTSAATAAAILRAAAPKASKELSRSIKVHYVGDVAEVVVEAPHAAAVELGCKPHMPPLGPLMRWAEIVKHGENPRDVAWKVARAISERGLRPTWFVRSSLPKIVRATMTRVEYILEP